MGPLSLAVSTWSLGLPVCDATQSENDSTLILLNNLQQENKQFFFFKKPQHKHNSHSLWQQRKWWFLLFEIIEVTHLQRKPNSQGKEHNCEDAGKYNQDPATYSQRACPVSWEDREMNACEKENKRKSS